MGREYEGIRELVAQQTARLERVFPGKNHLWQRDIVEAFEVSPEFVRSRYGIGREGIDVLGFAWILARATYKTEKRGLY